MKLPVKSLLLSMALAGPAMPAAYAMGSKAPSTPTQPSKPSTGDQLIDLGLNLAITYAKMDPRYGTILTALGINNAQDLRAFLKGNGNGDNIRNIVAHLAFQRAQKDPKVKAVLTQLGITDQASLRAFLSAQSGSSGFETILSLALAQAQANPKYAVWLERLNIKDVQDLRNLLRGNGQQGNLQALVLIIAMNYLESNPKYAKYVPIVQAAMMTLGINFGDQGSGGEGSDDDVIDLGAFKGMTVGEVKAVRSIK